MHPHGGQATALCAAPTLPHLTDCSSPVQRPQGLTPGSWAQHTCSLWSVKNRGHGARIYWLPSSVPGNSICGRWERGQPTAGVEWRDKVIGRCGGGGGDNLNPVCHSNFPSYVSQYILILEVEKVQINTNIIFQSPWDLWSMEKVRNRQPQHSRAR